MTSLPMIKEEDNEFLYERILKEEVKLALFEMQPNKTRGLGNFNSLFDQQF